MWSHSDSANWEVFTSQIWNSGILVGIFLFLMPHPHINCGPYSEDLMETWLWSRQRNKTSGKWVKLAIPQGDNQERRLQTCWWLISLHSSALAQQEHSLWPVKSPRYALQSLHFLLVGSCFLRSKYTDAQEQRGNRGRGRLVGPHRSLRRPPYPFFKNQTQTWRARCSHPSSRPNALTVSLERDLISTCSQRWAVDNFACR